MAACFPPKGMLLVVLVFIRAQSRALMRAAAGMPRSILGLPDVSATGYWKFPAEQEGGDSQACSRGQYTFIDAPERCLKIEISPSSHRSRVHVCEAPSQDPLGDHPAAADFRFRHSRSRCTLFGARQTQSVCKLAKFRSSHPTPAAGYCMRTCELYLCSQHTPHASSIARSPRVHRSADIVQLWRDHHQFPATARVRTPA